jgi:hypothetical protein
MFLVRSRRRWKLKEVVMSFRLRLIRIYWANAYDIDKSKIIQSRIIPVNTSLAKDPNTYELTTNLDWIDHSHSLFEDIPMARELTHDESLNPIIERMIKKRNSLIKAYSRDKGNFRLKNQLDFISNHIKLLQKKTRS